MRAQTKAATGLPGRPKTGVPCHKPSAKGRPGFTAIRQSDMVPVSVNRADMWSSSPAEAPPEVRITSAFSAASLRYPGSTAIDGANGNGPRADARGIASFGDRDTGAYELVDDRNLIVTSTADGINGGDDEVTLREAILAANARDGVFNRHGQVSSRRDLAETGGCEKPAFSGARGAVSGGDDEERTCAIRARPARSRILATGA